MWDAPACFALCSPRARSFLFRRQLFNANGNRDSSKFVAAGSKALLSNCSFLSI